MLDRTRWRLLEEPCLPEVALQRWHAARDRGAVGAVTSWGSGIPGRQTIRLFWEQTGGEVPDGEDLVEENWTPYWRSSFRVTPVTDSIHLIPAWESVPERVDRPIRIDPGMAFGAGDHPTTRLCLQVLEELLNVARHPIRMLDVGTGTGVLALGAARLGVLDVVALDIDPFGYAACRRNAHLNRLQDTVRPVLLSLDLVDARYPLIVANIVAGQLTHLAEQLVRCLQPGGVLLLSGFETDAEAKVVQRMGLPPVKRHTEEDWVAVAVHKPEG